MCRAVGRDAPCQMSLNNCIYYLPPLPARPCRISAPHNCTPIVLTPDATTEPGLSFTWYTLPYDTLTAFNKQYSLANITYDKIQSCHGMHMHTFI